MSTSTAQHMGYWVICTSEARMSGALMVLIQAQIFVSAAVKSSVKTVKYLECPCTRIILYCINMSAA